ncbi:MAG: molybdenum cofactor biosynthesis protein MoaB [Thermoplasmata archaeon]|nr:molybdenum cofactor biosynthesis protein MoaB [Thermoplasmata archaeon]
MGLEEHRKKGPERVRCAVIVTSDTREVETDKSGSTITQLLQDAGHEISDYRIVPNDAAALTDALESTMKTSQAIIISGGTGVSKGDITVDVVEPLFERRLSGFGELFRHLSYDEIGSATIVSRAVAGTIGTQVIFCLPGSEGAVKLAMKELILPEISHIVGELEK